MRRFLSLQLSLEALRDYVPTIKDQGECGICMHAVPLSAVCERAPVSPDQITEVRDTPHASNPYTTGYFSV